VHIPQPKDSLDEHLVTVTDNVVKPKITQYKSSSSISY
jgi:hypothetical protein